MLALIDYMIGFSNSLDGTEFAIVLVLCLLGSVVGFVAAFTFLRSGRIMRDTPTSKIRSASQGYVEIEGNAKSIDGALKAPGSGIMCAWFRYIVEEYTKDSNGRKSWQIIEEDTSVYSFYIDDGTGVCAVDPTEAKVISKKQTKWRSGKYRFKEKRIDEGDFLYCLGLFETEQGPSRAQVLKEGTKALLNRWKRDRAALLNRFDTNNDGEISLEEWNKARAAAAAVTQKEIDADYEPSSHHVLVKPFNRGYPHLISAFSGDELTAKYKWYSLAGYSIFFILGLAGALLAVTRANFLF